MHGTGCSRCGRRLVKPLRRVRHPSVPQPLRAVDPYARLRTTLAEVRFLPRGLWHGARAAIEPPAKRSTPVQSRPMPPRASGVIGSIPGPYPAGRGSNPRGLTSTSADGSAARLISGLLVVQPHPRVRSSRTGRAGMPDKHPVLGPTPRSCTVPRASRKHDAPPKRSVRRSTRRHGT